MTPLDVFDGVVDVVDATNKIAIVELLPITSLLGKTTGVISAGSTTDWAIYAGVDGSEAPSTFVAPPAWVRSDLPDDIWLIAMFIQNGWHLTPDQCLSS